MASLVYDVKHTVVSGHPTLAGLCPLHGFRKAAPAHETLASLGFVSLTVWKERQPCNVQTAAGGGPCFQGTGLLLSFPQYGSLLWPYTALGLTPDSTTHYENLSKLLPLMGPL